MCYEIEHAFEVGESFLAARKGDRNSASWKDIFLKTKYTYSEENY